MTGPHLPADADIVQAPVSPDFTVKDVLEWARTKPAGEAYDYTAASRCALAQFGQATDRRHLIDLPYLHDRYPVIGAAVQGVGRRVDWTYGGLVRRLEALGS